MLAKLPKTILLALAGGTIAALAVTAVALAAVHAPVAPQNTSLPSISGAARDGSALGAFRGGWANNPTSFSYQWQRCDDQGGGCQPIANGGTGSHYTVTGGDVGHRIKVVVTATNKAGAGTATSRATDSVKATGTAPVNTAPPVVSGTFKEGGTLSVANGTWTGSPLPTFAFRWQRCDATGGACVDLASASTATYKAVSGDVGNTLRVKVTATNSHGSTLATTTETTLIAPAGGTGGGGGGGGGKAIAVGQVSLPNRLIVDNLRFTPNPLRSRGAFVARFHVSDSRGFSIQGAMVYALGLPYSWSGTAPEATTDGTGWATITLRPTALMPLSRGALVIFVRARKPGDDLLAGVSTRRLVQVGIGSVSH
jgi:hypothetical protein